MKKTIDKEQAIPTITPALTDLVLRLDSLQATRQAIASVIAPALQAIDKDIKGSKAAIKESIAHLSATDAVKVATHFCAIVLRQGDSTPKQVQRRRDTFRQVLESQFPDYDFERDSIGRFSCKYIGDFAVRQANGYLAKLAELAGLGFSFTIERDDLVSAIKAQQADENGRKNVKVMEIDKTLASHYLALAADNLTTAQGLVQDGEALGEAKKVKAA